jgi:hypothetical protein
MKPYTKTVSPDELLPWQGSGRTWEDFAHDAASYQPVKAVLQAEQQHLCCYCETGLAAADSHIGISNRATAHMGFRRGLLTTLTWDAPVMAVQRETGIAVITKATNMM